MLMDGSLSLVSDDPSKFQQAKSREIAERIQIYERLSQNHNQSQVLLLVEEFTEIGKEKHKKAALADAVCKSLAVTVRNSWQETHAIICFVD
jgi:hypothetical protein